MVKFNEYLMFLRTIVQGEMLIDELAEDLEIHKKNLHRLIHRAENEGLMFIRHRVNGGLYSITLRPKCWETLRARLGIICNP